MDVFLDESLDGLGFQSVLRKIKKTLASPARIFESKSKPQFIWGFFVFQPEPAGYHKDEAIRDIAGLREQFSHHTGLINVPQSRIGYAELVAGFAGGVQ